MIDPGEYARQVERYLCQKNRGHLIRVVGPAFELVCGWATAGVPLKIALRGIDRCCERLEARGPRRRPVRIEFCEADVLDAFDDGAVKLGLAAALRHRGEVSQNRIFRGGVEAPAYGRANQRFDDVLKLRRIWRSALNGRIE